MHLPNIRQFSRQNTITFLIGLLLFNAAGFFIINQILSLDGQFRIQNFINIKFIYGNELGDVSSTGISEFFYNTLVAEKGAACNIPKLDPFEPKALQLIKADEVGKEPPKCISQSNVKFRADPQSGYLILVNSTQQQYLKSLSCCYIGYFGPYGLVKKETSVCYPIPHIKTKIPYHYEFINVKCFKKDNIAKGWSWIWSSGTKPEYQDQFEFFRLNQTLQNIKTKSLRSLHRFMLPEASTTTSSINSKAENMQKPNIIFLGIDSISHTNFIRFLPKTRKYLLENLDGIEYFGRNKVSVSTQGNLLPMITGCTLAPESMYPLESDCIPIWKDHGYFDEYTILRAEDDFGLQNQFFPTLHGWNQSHSYTDYHWLAYLKLTKNLNINKANQYTFGCFDYQWVQSMLMERIYNVAAAFGFQNKNVDRSLQPYFHFIWTSTITHDIIGYARYLDEPLHNLLTKLDYNGSFNNTILILVSDHGVGYGTYSRETNEGSIESRMPLLYFVFPKWFKQKYSDAIKNMKVNSMRLTTPYDLYETLRDLYDLKRIENNPLISVPTKHVKGPRQRHFTGISLFKPVPLNRTCESAGIPENWCICSEKTTIPNPNQVPELQMAANFALNELNKRLAPFYHCNQLKLDKIQIARKIVTKLFKKTSYEIVFKTLPGSAIFEGVIAIISNKDYRLIGDILRVNPYGQRGACLDTEYYSKNITVPYLVNSACYCTT